MKDKSDGIGKKIAREFVRTALERGQTIDLSKLAEKEGLNFDDVKEKLNVPYINRDEVPLAMDIFEPMAPKAKELPVIVIIHGGGLALGDRSISRPFGRVLAHRGYLVFSVEYRLAPRANVCQQLDDVCAGMNVVGEMLVNYNVDFTRIFLAAESAGANLALYVAAMKNSPRLQEAIGYEPSRIPFKAIGLNCGMLYTNLNDPLGKILSDQIYGDKRTDTNFLEFMNPEHPEIIKNLPPTFLSTSRGDVLNNYSFMFNEALKKNGKEKHFVYCSDADLEHAFFTMQTEHPKTLECIDKMLSWFEKEADKERKQVRKEAKNLKQEKVEKRIASGEINDQFIWKYLKERNGISDKRMDSTVLIDCTREYTFRECLAEWERYARVFSALKMTGANKTRCAIVGAITAEPMFAFFGLNMTGATVSMFSYPDFLPGGMWKEMLTKEKITDLIISDIMVTPSFWKEILEEKKKLHIRNVILMHSLMGGPCVGPAELFYNEFNYTALRRMENGPVFMGELLEKYADRGITYGKYDPKHIALITHTSGTTKGTRKPLPFLDSSVNKTATGLGDQMHVRCRVSSTNRQVRIALPFDYSSFLTFAGEAIAMIANDDTVVLTFFGFMHPKFVRAAKYYHLDILFTSGFILDKWMQMDDLPEDAFSTVRMFACGGAYLPVDKLKKYKQFLRDHGYRHSISRGYGMSETGGAQLSVPDGCDEDILGYPSVKEDFRIFEEETGTYLTMDDAGHTGVLYIASDSLCENELDGEKLFDYTRIDGRDFICTNDLVLINETGSLSYVGRADNFFVNNEGIRFLSGQVDRAMNSQPEIDRCAIVPIFDKRIHDTVPMLYTVPATKGEKAPEEICKALVRVFVTGGLSEKTSLPSQLVLVKDIPMNSNGKMDIYRITRERLTGDTYNIVPVMDGKKVTDITLEKTDGSTFTAGTLPQGKDNLSAMGMFNVFFNSQGEKHKKRDRSLEMTEAFFKIGSRLTSRLYNQRNYDKDIEE